MAVIGAAAAVAAVVLVGFWIGLESGKKSPKATAETQQADALPASAPEISTRFTKGYADPDVQRLGALGTAELPPPDTSAAQASVTNGQPAPLTGPQKPADPAVLQAHEQALAARSANPFFSGASPLATSGPSYGAQATILGPVPALQAAGLPPEADSGNGQAAKRQFLASAKAEDYLASPLREPLSPWEVKAGTIIPAALLTAINSDLPGEIIAQVTEPVYDHSTGRTVLIPQGSRLIGQYDSQVVYGQERALIAWSRIVMPNGRSINIGSMGGADLSGASGLKDQVDAHLWQLAKGVMLSTVISIGAASTQDATARSSGGLVLNSAGTGVASEAQQVGQQLTGRNLARQPTITIRAGWPLRVLVNKDMILAPYI